MDNKHYIIVLSLLFLMMTIKWEAVNGQRPFFSFQPGEEVPAEYLKEHGHDAFFHSDPIPDSIFCFIEGKSFQPGCTTPRESLRYLRCLHYDLDGKARVGEMIANMLIADDLIEIFRELFVHHYPIEKMRLVDNWDADDERAMRDNNSSAFNFRFVSHTKKVSKHGVGMAVDINPLYNPYYKRLADGREIIEPATGKAYLERAKVFPYKITKGDLCHKLFIQHGFTWGGEWRSCKDYQHFERRLPSTPTKGH